MRIGAENKLSKIGNAVRVPIIGILNCKTDFAKVGRNS